MGEQEKLLLTDIDKIIPLNDNLYDDFFIEELEARLETDPFVMGGLLDLLQQTEEVTLADFCLIESGSCTEQTCSAECGMFFEICKCVFDFF